VVDIQNDGVYAGGISVSGGTVTYHTFTGSHLGTSAENYHFGEIVKLTGRNGYIEDNCSNEIIYGVERSAKANDKAILGAYVGEFDGSGTSSVGPLHNIMAVGNGRMWVVDNGNDIEPGDYLISSDVAGHAMNDPGTFPVSHIIARAAEPVDWTYETQYIKSQKHKLISVTFENYDKVNDLSGFQSALNVLEEKLDQMQKQVNHQEKIILEQKETISALINEKDDRASR
jgi:hypothetical protein